MNGVLKTMLTTTALQRLLAGGLTQPDGPFEESDKPDHIVARFDSIKIQQYSNALVVEYIFRGDPLVLARADVNTGLQALLNLNNLNGRIELFVHGGIPTGKLTLN